MDNKKRVLVLLCLLCLLLGGCSTDVEVTPSGSDMWSPGVVVGTTPQDAIAVAAWQEETFVAWIAEDSHVQLAHLDVNLEPISVTNLPLMPTYPADIRLEVESANRVHLTWEDRFDGVPTIVYASLTPGQSQPTLEYTFSLPDNALLIATEMQLEEQRIDVVWSDTSGRNSGLFATQASLADGTMTPVVHLTEEGWGPGLGWGPAGELVITWFAPSHRSDHVIINQAPFDPQTSSLQESVLVVEVKSPRGYLMHGPATGNAGSQAIVAWSIGPRFSLHGFFTVQGNGLSELILGGRLEAGSTETGISRGDMIEYAIVPPVSAEATQLPRSLIGGSVIGGWKGPQLQSTGDQVWAVYSGWVLERGNDRLQIAAVEITEEGSGEPVAVSETWQPSLAPALAAGSDGTLRVAWVEGIGDDLYRVVVASTAPETREALDKFRLSELLESLATLWVDAMGLLIFFPYVIGWTVLPWGLVIAGTYFNPDRLSGWRSTLWLWAALPVHIVCKWYIAPALIPLGPSLERILFGAIPHILGLALAAIYMLRAKKPSLLAAYGLFAVTDALFSLFVGFPNLLWGAG